MYVFVVIEHGTRRLIHTNVTESPTADWARQQLREAVLSDHEYQYLIHDDDCIISAEVDTTVSNLGIKPIKTPYRSPKANAICERLISTMRRECLDYVIPFTQNRFNTNTWRATSRLSIDVYLINVITFAEHSRVERAIRYIRDSFFARRQWRDLDDLDEQALQWCREVARERRCPEESSLGST